MNRIFSCILFLCCTLPSNTALAWDRIGHRLTASVAMNYLSQDKKSQLLGILRQHPRFQQDFIEAMPASIARADAEQRLDWLLGQAAYWPDIARGLSDAERQKYNRPAWHYIDGAWVRDAATSQGNSYIGIDRFADTPGEAAEGVRNQQQVHNVMTALDYQTRVLTGADNPPADRAIALCWVLHLFGDIHQPLHTGSLFSAGVFADGDRGGNGIATDDDNLHLRWDRALGEEPIADTLVTILQQQSSLGKPRIQGVESDWSQWLSESRQLLLSSVYTDAMKSQIAVADQSGRNMQVSVLRPAYVLQMKRIARQQLGLAGLRLAIWFENELD
ncbi:MAG: S1/P1 nuclease [Proteobacteria bacterium]|nr:S1/P1 nuclease [Pseudomonadota bacterium]